MTVQVDLLTKRFGARQDVVGVESISFTAAEHGITSLLGPSGSGKSTLLRLIAGLEVPDSGRVLIDGADVTRTPVREREIGFVFQNYALFNHMTVFDNVAFGLSVRRRSKREIAERVTELLALMQLDSYDRRLPDQLSGGQRQRVAFARALATRPRVLLLDEPFGALDTQVRVELREWLRELHDKTRVTTILVTHDQEEALELSERVVLLRGGTVAQAGQPHELYEHPATGFVASFLGGAKVLRGRVTGGRARFGAEALTTPAGLAEGTEVEAFVRPHDLAVRKATSSADRARVARVERVARVGSYVKLFVVLPDGEGLSVQMAWHEFRPHDISAGDNVLLDLRDVTVEPWSRVTATSRGDAHRAVEC